MTQLIAGPPPAPKRKRSFPVVVAGANRGARESLRAYSDYNQNSNAIDLTPIYADPVPGRAMALVDTATGRGVNARAVEAKIEDVIGTDDVPAGAPIVLNLDRASAIASALAHVDTNPRPVIGFLLLKLPTGKLWGVRFVLETHDVVARRSLRTFFERLATVTERGSSNAILGAGADPAHVLAEPAVRAWFAEHLASNLAKLVAGVEPVSNSIEVTTDGRDTRVLHVVARDTWAVPTQLAEIVATDPEFPVRRGSSFVIAEVTPSGIRFHEARHRTDCRVTVQGAEQVDAESMAAREEVLSAAPIPVVPRPTRQADQKPAPAVVPNPPSAPEVRAPIVQANRTTVTRSNPVETTD